MDCHEPKRRTLRSDVVRMEKKGQSISSPHVCHSMLGAGRNGLKSSRHSRRSGDVISSSPSPIRPRTFCGQSYNYHHHPLLQLQRSQLQTNKQITTPKGSQLQVIESKHSTPQQPTTPSNTHQPQNLNISHNGPRHSCHPHRFPPCRPRPAHPSPLQDNRRPRHFRPRQRSRQGVQQDRQHQQAMAVRR